MTRSSSAAVSFLQELTEAAERLARRDVVVVQLTSDWGRFGSWVIEASAGVAEDTRGEAIRSGNYEVSGPDIVRVTWDGRERDLRVDLFHTTALSRSYSAVQLQGDKKFASNADALEYAEHVLLDRLADA
jgi:hypothetical protein